MMQPQTICIDCPDGFYYTGDRLNEIEIIDIGPVSEPLHVCMRARDIGLRIGYMLPLPSTNCERNANAYFFTKTEKFNGFDDLDWLKHDWRQTKQSESA